jgi:lipopolysaccharide/colanic/teichoic acid biosynthesis glycosyltransferase
MFKRTIDIGISAIGLLATAPVLAPAMLLIWLQDGRTPLYMAPRVGRGGRLFRMVKLRSMVVNADRTGVDSTSARDPRITAVGRIVRRFKLDELAQLWNVLAGDMSLVGPRPNVERETARYTAEERRLLSVRPGITDISSIVFADLGDVLKDSADPNLDYNRLVRPWKSRFGLFYIEHRSTLLDLALILLTGIAIVSRPTALALLSQLIAREGASDELCRVATRSDALRPCPPPGADRVVCAADLAAAV